VLGFVGGSRGIKKGRGREQVWCGCGGGHATLGAPVAVEGEREKEKRPKRRGMGWKRRRGGLDSGLRGERKERKPGKRSPGKEGDFLFLLINHLKITSILF
jgi:hypothetical protein